MITESDLLDEVPAPRPTWFCMKCRTMKHGHAEDTALCETCRTPFGTHLPTEPAA